MDIRQDPTDENAVAIRTGGNVTAGAWFYYHRNNGGGYTDGVHQDIENWAVVEPVAEPGPEPEPEA